MREAELGIAARLNPARRGNARGDLGRAFRRCGQHEIRSAYRRNFDHEIDAVEEGSGEARLILGEATGDRLTIAAEARIEGVAATAGIHGRDELETGGIDDAMIGAGDGHFAGLERLAQAIEHLRLELRYYVPTSTRANRPVAT